LDHGASESILFRPELLECLRVREYSNELPGIIDKISAKRCPSVEDFQRTDRERDPGAGRQDPEPMRFAAVKNYDLKRYAINY
jgi:hypothetical protein